MRTYGLTYTHRITSLSGTDRSHRRGNGRTAAGGSIVELYAEELCGYLLKGCGFPVKVSLDGQAPRASQTLEL